MKYNLEKLNKVINNFHKLTGISIAVVDTDFHSLTVCRSEERSQYCNLIQSTPEGFSRCHISDYALLSHCKRTLEPQTHVCHAGLSDTVVPMVDRNSVLGYVIFGQVCSSSKPATPFSDVYPDICDLGIDRDVLQKAYERIAFVSEDMIAGAAEIVKILTKYICLEHMIHHDDMADEIVAYIKSNLHRPLEVKSLCKHFHISKNTLYKLFREQLDSTVNDYITARRIDEAERLLTQTSLAVYQIAESVGIHNDQYFCRIFKQFKGLPPLQYRKHFSTQEKADLERSLL